MSHPQVPLGDIADFINGSAFKPEDWGEDGLPIIRIQNLTDSSKSFNYTRREVSEKLVVNPGDLLVSWSATLGVFQWNGPQGLLNQHIFRVLADDALVDTSYLRHALERALDDMERHLHGATMKHVNRGEFLGTKIPLPPLEEQRRIAAILDKASYIHTLAAEKAKKSALGLYRSLLMQELEQPEVEWVQLGDVLEIARGGSPRPIQAFLTDDPDGINWIMIGDAGVGEKYITKTAKKIRHEGLSKTRLVKEGDLLLSNSMSFGRPYIMKTDGAIHDGWLVLRDAHAICSPDYLYHVLGSPTCYAQFARAAAGATVKNLNTSIVSSVEIPLPPLEKQLKIADRLDAVEIHVGRRFALLAVKAEQLRSSLTSSLFQAAS